MGRELQKKKRRSGKPKLRMKPPKPHGKQLQGKIEANALLARKFDPKLSLSENYANLGLARQLQSSSGGSKSKAALPVVDSTNKKDVASEDEDADMQAVEEVKVQRDPTTGAIISVFSATPHSRKKPTTSKKLTGPLSLLDEEEPQERELHMLEKEMISSGPKKRTQSVRERAWIEQLIAAHGMEGYEAMARDAVRNIRQQSAGDIKKRVKKYLADK